MAIIAPSLLSADFLHLGDTVEMLNRSDAGWIHLDIMDGRFVPNISFGIPVVKAVKKLTIKPLDVHLMIVEPENYFEDFKSAGADILSIHYEASVHLNRSVRKIQDLGMKAGVVLNPHTPVQLLTDIIHETDLVLLMSVNPGFGGQKFIENTIRRVEALKEMIIASGKEVLIEVDGGVDQQNASRLVSAGADILVAGNTIFSSSNPLATITQLSRV